MKRMNRGMAVILAAAAAAGCAGFPMQALAAETTMTVRSEAEESQETTTTEAVDQNVDISKLTFMEYDDSAALIKCDEDAEGIVNIPAKYNGLPVTMIGAGAFQNCSRITKVTIPDSIDTIGYSAFNNARALQTVKLSGSIKVVPSNCFYGCEKLESIEIPDNVTNLGSSAFYNCKSLSSVVLSQNLKELGGNAFYNCNALYEIELPSSLSELGYSAFSGCTLKRLIIKNPNMRNLSLDNVTIQKIYGYEESTAKTYADQKGIFFEALEGDPEVPYTAYSTAKAYTTAYAMQQGMRKFNVDNKSNVTVADAVFLARYVAEDDELETPEEFNPDVNGDGTVDVNDVMAVLHALEPFCLKIGTVTAKAGTKVTIPVMVYSDKGTAGGQVYISHDSKLTPVSIKAGDAYDMTFSSSTDSYPLYIGWSAKKGKDQIAKDNAVLAYIEFEVNAHAESDSFLSVSVSSSAGSNSTRFTDETGYTFSASYKSGYVYVS